MICLLAFGCVEEFQSKWNFDYHNRFFSTLGGFWLPAGKGFHRAGELEMLLLRISSNVNKGPNGRR